MVVRSLEQEAPTSKELKWWEYVTTDFMQQSGFEKEDADEIFTDFNRIFLEYLENLDVALEVFDYESIQRIAHQLKGASANLRVEPIMLLTERLEAWAKKENFTECSRMMEELKKIK